MAQLLRLPLDAARLIFQHWPVLVSLCLAGLAVRQGVIWLAVLVSGVSPLAAYFVIPCAALAMMVAVILMLNTFKGSLSFSVDHDGDDLTDRRTLAVMVPLVAVYTAQGLMGQDLVEFRYDVTRLEQQAGIGLSNFGRVIPADGWLLIGLVVGAFTLRKLISWTRLDQRWTVAALASIYLEVLWLATFARAAARYMFDVGQWLSGRRAFAWTRDIAEFVESVPGWFGDVVRGTSKVLVELSVPVGTLVLLSIAWLCVGALVFGEDLVDKESRDFSTVRGKAMPKAMVRGVSAAAEAASPVLDAWRAFRSISAAGLATIVWFIVLFGFAGQVPVLVAFVSSWLVGPQDAGLAEALVPYHRLAQDLAYFVVMVALLGAAVNSLVGSSKRNLEVVGGPSDA